MIHQSKKKQTVLIDRELPLGLFFITRVLTEYKTICHKHFNQSVSGGTKLSEQTIFCKLKERKDFI